MDGLSGHMFGLTGYGGYGLKSGNFGILVHMRGEVVICYDFVGKGGLDVSNMSYVVCWKYFWGQVVNGLRNEVLRSIYAHVW